MSESVVEVHVPMVPTQGLATRDDQFPWMGAVEDHVGSASGVQMGGDAEQSGEEYLFYLSGADEDRLIEVAREIAGLSGVPSGVYAVVPDADRTDSGLRIDL